MTVTPDRLKRLREMLDDAEECPRLSDWDDGFLASMRRRVALDGDRLRLSEKQEAALQRIEKKVYAT